MDAGEVVVKTWWNGKPAQCARVKVIVGEPVTPLAWFRPFVGTVRQAVLVSFEGDNFFLDDESGKAWLKVTTGKGDPRIGHLSLPITSKLVMQVDPIDPLFLI